MRSTEPRSRKRPSIVTGSGTLRGSRPSSDRPKLNSKYAGFQLAGLRQPPHPDAQIAAEGGDLVAPDAIDRRREPLAIRRGDLGQLRSTSCSAAGSAAGVDRQRPCACIDGRTRPAPRGRARRGSADRAAAAAPARRSARAGRSPTAGTGTDRSRTSAAPTASTAGPRAAASRASAWSPREARTNPSCGVQRDRARAQRVVTDRRSASFSRSR